MPRLTESSKTEHCNLARLSQFSRLSILCEFVFNLSPSAEDIWRNGSHERLEEPGIIIGTPGLFDLILYIPSTIFQLNRDRSSWVEPVLS